MVWLKISSRVPCSTICPAYTTETSSQTSAIIPRSWVIMIIAEPNFFLKSFIVSRTCAWIVTSRAVVGSSARRSFGLQARAIAITTRCFIPPENWCGYSPKRSLGIPTTSSISPAFCSASFSLILSWSLITSAIWSPTVSTGFKDVIGSWKIMETVFPRIASSSFCGIFKISFPSRRMEPFLITPGGSGTRRRIERAVVVFPDPVSPTSPNVFPCSNWISMPFTASTTPSSVS